LKYDQKCIENLDKRNFFAHAGFERTVTMVKKESGDILIKYDEQSWSI
jgi:CRISPR/Cas system-associated protein Csx1